MSYMTLLPLLSTLLTIGLLHSNSYSSNSMIVRASLKSREHRQIDLIPNVVHDLVALVVDASHTLPVEDQPSPGPSEGLVNSRGDNITVEERRRSYSSSNKTRDMGHVSKKP